MTGRNILVIKLGALGDFIYALGPMAAIRRHHPQDRITLLTTRPFAALGKDCGYFNEVLIDQKPKWSQPGKWLELRRQLSAGQYSRVYDLQNNDRTSLYLRLFSPQPEWAGAAPGASHRNTSPDRVSRHAFYGHAQTLRGAGIEDTRLDTLEWMTGDITRFGLRSPYILLVPGSAPSRPEKRWPVEQYRRCAEALIAQGYQIVLLGTAAEAHTTAQIAKDLPVLDLTGQTALYDLAALGRGAVGAIANDTGPGHILSLTGCPVVMMFCTRSSTIAKHGPLGSRVAALEADHLEDISAERALNALRSLLKSP